MEDLLFITGLKMEDFESVNDLEVLCDCLVLKQEKYTFQEFMDRDDFIAVYAPNLVEAADYLFFNCSKLQIAYLPNLKMLGRGVFG